MTLQDKRIVVTRAPHQALTLVEMLRERGAIPLIYPCIDIAPPDDVSGLDSALRNLHNYEWLVVTSSNTVLAMKRRFQSLQIKPDLAHIKIAAVGQSTAASLQELFGVTPEVVPEKQSGQGLAEVMTVHESMSVLMPQSAIARPELAHALIEQGASVNCIEAYKTVIGYGGEDVPGMFNESRVDAVTFTSPSTVEYFVERMKPRSAQHLPAACIGPTTGEAAVVHGFQSVLIPEKHTLDAMLDRLEQHFS